MYIKTSTICRAVVWMTATHFAAFRATFWALFLENFRGEIKKVKWPVIKLDENLLHLSCVIPKMEEPTWNRGRTLIYLANEKGNGYF